MAAIISFFIVLSATALAEQVGIANPSAIYCEELGYKYKIEKTGVCVIEENAIEYDAWDFFEGKVGQQYSYCSKHGYDIETVKDGKNQYSREYSVCVIKKSSGPSIQSIKEKKPVTELMDLNKNSIKKSVKIEGIENSISESVPEDYGISSQPYFDWRNVNSSNWTTPVKDQGGCGSCWAFASIGAIESKIKITKNNSSFDKDLSEQDLVSCFAENGCNGIDDSQFPSLLSYIQSNGVTDEPCFPYSATNEPCSNKCPTWKSRLWYIDGYGSISNASKTKDYLTEKGPLIALIGMSGYFDSNGIYRCIGTPSLNHAIIIVGYNDTGGYWIAKNSWGSGWNGNGYFNVGYNECNIIPSYYIGLPNTGNVTETNYCSAVSKNSNYENIVNVSLNGNERNSGRSNYTDFTNTTLTNLTLGNTYTLYVTGNATAQASPNEFVKAWIDFNNDKSFSNDEAIDFGNFTFVGKHTFNKSFTVPNNATVGETRMRVYLKWKSAPTPCENASYGEVEDYKIGILSPPSNATQTNLTSCAVLNQTGATYYLKNDIINSTNTTCMNITTNNITLDCQNHKLTGNNSIYGIYSTGTTGNVIKNCIITNFTYGIVLSSSSNNALINNTANSNGVGIFLHYASNNTLTNNTVNSNGIGIDLYISSYNNIQLSNLTNNSIGIYSDGSFSNINTNYVCGSTNLDFNSSNWYSSSGNNNTCDKPDGWNDNGFVGCKYTCTLAPVLITINSPFNGTVLTENSVWFNLTTNRNSTCNYGLIKCFTFDGGGGCGGGSSMNMSTSDGTHHSALVTSLNNTANSEWYQIGVNCTDGVVSNSSYVIFFVNMPVIPLEISIIRPINNSLITINSTVLEVSINQNGTCQYSLDHGYYSNFSYSDYKKEPSVNALNVSDCMELNETGKTYTLTNDINVTNSFYDLSCLAIKADYVTLDCKGHNIINLGPGGLEGIHNHNSFVTIKNCIVKDFRFGINISMLYNSNNNIADSNTVIYNGNVTWSGGILAREAFNITFINNTIIGDNLLNYGEGNNFGIFCTNCINSTITRNSISNYQFSIGGISNSLIYNNYFNNSINVGGLDNIWNITKTLGINIVGGPYIGGNFWSDYNGTDIDGDGIGDTNLPYKGGDYLPLVAQESSIKNFTQMIYNLSEGKHEINVKCSFDGNETNKSVFFSIVNLPTLVNNWTVNLSIDLNSVQKGIWGFGMSDNATDLFDNGIDDTSPPASPEGFDAYFAENELTPKDRLSIDIKKIADDKNWTLVITAPKQQIMIVKWNSTIDTNLTLKIGEVDSGTGNYIGEILNMKYYDSLTFSGGANSPVTKSYKITASKSSYKIETLNLNAGWNLISVPLILQNNSVQNVFDNKVQSVWAYENGIWKIWVSGVGGTLTSINPKIGYWVATNENKLIVVEGTENTNHTIQLYKGWSLIGPTKSISLPLSNPHIIGSIWGWTGNSYISVTDSLEPKKAYWIAASQNTTIEE